jgi:integrase/recombinase XerD
VEDQLRLLAHASRWLAEQDLDASGMTPRRADLFRVARRSEGYVRSGSARALSPLLGYLRGLGIVPESAAAAVATPAEVLLAEYRDYLVCERGLVAGSVRLYERCACRKRHPPCSGWVPNIMNLASESTAHASHVR